MWPFSRWAKGVADIRTARLRLMAITPAMLVADGADNGLLAGLIGASLTAEWPPNDREPHVMVLIEKQFEAKPASVGWHRYVLLPGDLGVGPTLIGAVGGFPQANGDVEVSYSILPEFQRHGYGTESVVALVEYLLARDGVRSVSAQTFPRLVASVKIMQRCGMTFSGSGDEEGTVRYRRMR